MMRRFISLAMVVISTTLFTHRANANEFGLGAVVGQPTAINGKVWTGTNSAVDFALSWSDNANRSFNAHVDYLHHDYTVFKVSKGKLPLYYGFGGRIKDDTDERIGLRTPVGLSYIFGKSPLDLFFEVAPVIDIVPETEMDVEAGIGVRFYFK